MTNVVLEDVTATALRGDDRAKRSALNGLLCFDDLDLRIDNPSLLDSVTIARLHLSHYMTTGWPKQGPPHPGLFAEFFPEIVQALADRNDALTIWVHGIDREYFNELQFIDQVLVPQGRNYMLLSGKPRNDQDGPVGHLFFEWPLPDLSFVVRQNWLHRAPEVEVEGYVSTGRVLEYLCSSFFQPPSEQRIISVVNRLRAAFRLWPDGNGLTICSACHDVRTMARRLRIEELNVRVAAAAPKYPV